MENASRLMPVFNALLVILSGFSAYFLFDMNKSLTSVKDNILTAQASVKTAQDSVKIMQARIDALLKETEVAKTKITELEHKANQVKIVYREREKKDAKTIDDSENWLKERREKQKTASKLTWAN